MKRHFGSKSHIRFSDSSSTPLFGLPGGLLLKGKGKKVKLSLCLTKYHAMRMYGGVELSSHAFFTSVLYGGKWSASCSGRWNLKLQIMLW